MKSTRLLALVGLAVATAFTSLPTMMRSAETATPAAAPVADPYWPADGVFPVPGRTSGWPGFRAKNVERRSLFAQRKRLDANSLVFVGDSIIEGWHTLAEDCAGLHVKLSNRGVGGDTTPNLVYRLQEDVLSLNPRGLVIMIGTNDLSEHTSTEQIASNLGEMLKRIRAAYPQIPIVWCYVMPRRNEDNYPAKIRDLNARIDALAKSDVNSKVCDTFTSFALPDGSSKPEYYLSDRLHPNAAGLAQWKEVLYPILDSLKLGVK